jgi:putative (di)nucleoside polyphosphate hydrolase
MESTGTLPWHSLREKILSTWCSRHDDVFTRMIDEQGYRPNVGIILCNRENQVFWARRCGQNGWQFPQGGINPQETPEQALFRELNEEVGLTPEHVHIMGRTKDWLHYDIPTQFCRSPRSSRFRGQKQIWFLLRFLGREEHVRLNVCDRPEFDSWRWVEYWSTLEQIVEFKRGVYEQALRELEPLLSARAAVQVGGDGGDVVE